MTDSWRLVLFAVVLVVALGLGLTIGTAVGPISAEGPGVGVVAQIGEVS